MKNPSEDCKLAHNVYAFIERAAKDYAAFQHQSFGQELHSDCLELAMESPLEHLFWVAMRTMCVANYDDFNPEPIERDGKFICGRGIHLAPQKRIGKFRVDFCAYREPLFENQRRPSVIVELDGHDFHDKDKKQRAYEKSRDRFLVKEGFLVLHFTGSELVADPYKAAHEALSLLGAVNTPMYDPLNPLEI